MEFKALRPARGQRMRVSQIVTNEMPFGPYLTETSIRKDTGLSLKGGLSPSKYHDFFAKVLLWKSVYHGFSDRVSMSLLI